MAAMENKIRSALTTNRFFTANMEVVVMEGQIRTAKTSVQECLHYKATPLD